MTDDSGRYAIAGVPARDVAVRVRALGFAEVERRLRVAAGGQALLDVGLVRVAQPLAAVRTVDRSERDRFENAPGV